MVLMGSSLILSEVWLLLLFFFLHVSFFGATLNFKKSCKDNIESSHVLLTQFPLLLTSCSHDPLVKTKKLTLVQD